MASDLAALDWAAPWLAPYATLGKGVALQVASGLAVFEAFNDAIASPARPAQPAVPQARIRFVAHSALPPDQSYEDFIFKTGQVPSRDNLHDFFNGLSWLHFPHTKKKLNQLQAAQIAQDGIGQVRGRVRDALTVVDENAAFLQAPDALWEALAEKDWSTVFITGRVLWQEARLTLFGHALMEKLVAPRKAITAHVYRVQPVSDSIADLDAWVAADLSAEKLSAKPFAHLPVLGVPGWWAANEWPGFYDDDRVFRLPKPEAANVVKT